MGDLKKQAVGWRIQISLFRQPPLYRLGKSRFVAQFGERRRRSVELRQSRSSLAARGAGCRPPEFRRLNAFVEIFTQPILISFGRIAIGGVDKHLRLAGSDLGYKVAESIKSCSFKKSFRSGKSFMVRKIDEASLFVVSDLIADQAINDQRVNVNSAILRRRYDGKLGVEPQGE